MSSAFGRIRTTQPRHIASIDWTNPLTAGLTFCASPGVMGTLGSARDYVSGLVLPTYSLASTQLVGAPENIFAVSAPTRLDAPLYVGHLQIGATRVTHLVLVHDFKVSPYGRVMLTDYSRGQPGIDNTGKIGFFTGSSGLVTGDTPYTESAASTFALVVTFRANQQHIYSRGVLRSSTTAYSTLTGLGSPSNIGGFTSGGVGNNAHAASLWLSWNRVLSHEEVGAISRNPWQVFTPHGTDIPTPAATGYTHPTLSAATATEIGTTSFKPRVTYTFPS